MGVETMNYEILVAIVVINALVTFSLWRRLTKGPDKPRLNKKAAKALWRSEPNVPKHDPPKMAGGEMSSLVRDVDRVFFADFEDLAEVTNWWLADEFIASRFRLQDLPDADLSLNVSFSDGPVFGRAFAIYYNQLHVGRLEIRPVYGYTIEHPKVSASVEIDCARFIGFDELTQFLGAISLHLATEDSDRMVANQSIQFGLTKTLWENYRISQYDQPDNDDWGELSVSFQGEARFYIERRDAPARKPERFRG